MSDSSTIHFTGQPDAPTYLALVKILRPQKTWSKSGLVLAGVVMFAAVGILVNNGIVGFVAVLLVLFLVGFVSLIPTLSKKLIEKQQKRAYSEATQKRKRSGFISPRGLQIKFTSGQTELDWSSFDRTIEFEDAIGLCKGSDLVEAISKSMFSTENDWQVARKIALGKVRSVCGASNS